MLKGKTIAVVVPCYNEETQISLVVRTMPDFVDLIIAVNDKSRDKTLEVLKGLQEEIAVLGSGGLLPDLGKRSDSPYDRVENALLDQREDEAAKYTPAAVFTSPSSKLVIIDHLENGGVGAAIASGYKYARDCRIDCTAVMAGDGQMDPNELESICLPVVEGRADYSKGNRLKHRGARLVIPKVRYYGNSILSILTKMASGYWRVSDTQTGYTAISLEALENIDIYKIYKSYGMPNDLLVKLNIASFSVTEVPIKPVYQVGEQSKMKIGKVIRSVSWLLVKLFAERMFKKYLLRDFHPLFLLYCGAVIGGVADLYVFARWVSEYAQGNVMYGWLVLLVTLGLFSFQSLIFAMWFDMQDNERLYV